MLCRTSSVWLLLILCLAQPRLHAEPPPRTHAMWVYDTEAIAYAGHPGFAGFAYFMYEAYRQMPQTAKEVPKTSTPDK